MNVAVTAQSILTDGAAGPPGCTHIARNEWTTRDDLPQRWANAAALRHHLRRLLQTDSQSDRQTDNGMPQQDCAVSAAHRLGSCGAAGMRLRFPDFLKHPEGDVPRAAGHV